MDKILIADDNKDFRELLESRLRPLLEQFEILFVNDGQEAVDLLDRQEVALVVTDIRMPRLDGFGLLSYMSRHCPGVPCIIMTGHESNSVPEELAGKISLFMSKPFSPEDLGQAIIKTLEGSPGGTLRGISIVSFLQIIEMEQKTCRLDVSSNEGHLGSLYFVQGELYDAVRGELRGEKAAHRLLVMEHVHIDLRQLAAETVEREIFIGIQSLTMQAMLFKDEHGGDTPPAQARIKELLSSGVRLCEERKMKQAQETLGQLLRQDPANAMGWLWLSRTMGDQDKIKEALSRASHLKPRNHEIIREVERVRNAQGALGEGRVSRCPFCWAPNDKSKQQCSCCHAFFVVSPAMFSEMGAAVPGLMDEAIDRFQRILLAGPNEKILYFLGLAYLNRNALDNALDTFDELAGLEQSEDFYRQQIAMLLEFLATRQLGAEEDEQEKPETRETPSEDRRPVILVAEDNPIARKVVAMTLRRNDFEAVEAVDGVEAIGRLTKEAPDLVILDIMMPKLDGYELLKIMKQRDDWKNIPVIILSARDNLVEKMKGKVAGANSYLSKPFKPEVLIEIVTKLLAKARK